MDNNIDLIKEQLTSMLSELVSPPFDEDARHTAVSIADAFCIAATDNGAIEDFSTASFIGPDGRTLLVDAQIKQVAGWWKTIVIQLPNTEPTMND